MPESSGASNNGLALRRPGSPTAAVFRQGDRYALFAVVENHARLTPIQVLARNAKEVEIKGPLALSAEVVIYPSDKLANGSALTPE